MMREFMTVDFDPSFLAPLKRTVAGGLMGEITEHLAKISQNIANMYNHDLQFDQSDEIEISRGLSYKMSDYPSDKPITIDAMRQYLKNKSQTANPAQIDFIIYLLLQNRTAAQFKMFSALTGFVINYGSGLSNINKDELHFSCEFDHSGNAVITMKADIEKNTGDGQQKVGKAISIIKVSQENNVYLEKLSLHYTNRKEAIHVRDGLWKDGFKMQRDILSKDPIAYARKHPLRATLLATGITTLASMALTITAFFMPKTSKILSNRLNNFVQPLSSPHAPEYKLKPLKPQPESQSTPANSQAKSEISRANALASQLYQCAKRLGIAIEKAKPAYSVNLSMQEIHPTHSEKENSAPAVNVVSPAA
jgi:hypothetical protein